MRTRITVTSQHIMNGRPRSMTHCPVALAFQEVISRQVDVHVTGDRVEFVSADEDKNIRLPLHVSRIIENYDKEGSFMEPFNFDLEVPLQLLCHEVQDVHLKRYAAGFTIVAVPETPAAVLEPELVGA